MYRHCISCSADLGTNQVLESFPTGRSLAFDPWKGRLWVICPRCARWNLTPMEERWEACEESERLFRDTRMKAQSENIGLARLPDGTRLIRVGKPVEGEMAAWRYGSQLVGRRKKYLIGTAIATAGMTAAASGLVAVGMAGLIGTAATLGNNYWEKVQRRRVIYRFPGDHGQVARTVRRWHVQGARLQRDDDGRLAVALWDLGYDEPKADGWGSLVWQDSAPTIISGPAAHAIIRRSMPVVNEKGASRSRVEDAIGLLNRAGSVERYLESVANQGGAMGKLPFKAKKSPRPQDPAIDAPRLLALEMALNEETERRALEGELSLLEEAWEAAEEIAAIADVLPFDPLEAFRRRLSGDAERPAT